MTIMPINIGNEEPTCGCGGCTCGATEVEQPSKEDKYQIITEL